MIVAHGGAAGLALEVLPLIVIPVLLVVALIRASRVKDDDPPDPDDL